MYELSQLGEHTYWISAETNVGVWEQNGEVWLFDSGRSSSDARTFLQLIQARGWKLRAVLNTHYHADHVGGNHALQEMTGCRCCCCQPHFVREPLLNPTFMFGAYPPKPVRVPFFLAEASNTEPLTQACLPEGISMLPFPGHAYEQYAFYTPDKVLFAADTVIGAEELNRYKMSYLFRLDEHLKSLEDLEKVSAAWYVPSHAQPVQEIAPLIACNRAAILELIDWILELCSGEGMGQDALLKALFDRTHRHMHLAQYALASSTLHAYLSYLIDAGRMIARSKENILLYKTLS